MATLEQLEAALRAADAAGNVEDARRLAQAYAQARSQQQPRADFSNVQGRSNTVAAEPPGLLRRAAVNLGGESFANALDAAQHHGMGAFHGLAQLVEHGVNAAANAVLPAPQQSMSGLVSGSRPRATGLARVRQYINDTVAADDAALTERERSYQGRVPDGAAASTGAVVGEILPWMVGIGELRAAGLLPKIEASGNLASRTLKKGAALSAEGALMGAAQPVIGDGPYAEQKARQVTVGAVAAPATFGAMAGTGAAVRGGASASRYLTDAGRESIANNRLARLYGDSPEVIARLQQASRVPGFQPTPAQAIGTPEAVQVERALRNNGITAPAFASRESANNAALRGEVAAVARDDAALEAAIAARREGPGAFWRGNLPRGAEDNRYGRAQKHLAAFLQSRPLARPEYNIIDQARLIAGQVERGTLDQTAGDAAIRALAPTTKAGKKALDQALGVIDGGMVNPSRLITELQRLAKDTNPTISKTANSALDAIARNQDGQGWVHARVLDGLRQNIGAMLRESAPMGGVGSAEGAVYGPLKAKIANQIDRAVPGYRANLAAYASASQPINDMQAGRALLDAIDRGGRDAGGNQSVSLTQVKSLLAKDNRADFPMSPAARQRLENVLEALQQRSIANNTIAASGPGTAADTLRGLQSNPFLIRLLGYGASSGGAVVGGLPGFLVGAGITEGASAANNAVLRKVGTKAADAKLTAEAIEAARKARLSKAEQSALVRMLTPLLPYYETRALPPPR